MTHPSVNCLGAPVDRPASGLPGAVGVRVPGGAGRGAGGECDWEVRRGRVPRVTVPAADWGATRGFDGTSVVCDRPAADWSNGWRFRAVGGGILATEVVHSHLG